MQSLDDFNRKRAEAHRALKAVATSLNGIACPNCGKELVDTCPNVVLDSYPPQKNVNCLACGYRGYRIA